MKKIIFLIAIVLLSVIAYADDNDYDFVITRIKYSNGTLYSGINTTQIVLYDAVTAGNVLYNVTKTLQYDNGTVSFVLYDVNAANYTLPTTYLELKIESTILSRKNISTFKRFNTSTEVSNVCSVILDNNTIVRTGNISWLIWAMDNNTIIRNNNITWFWNYVINGTMQNKMANNCSGTEKVTGFETNGTVICGADLNTGGGSLGTNGFYLYNDTTTIYFNETLLNITIWNLVNNGTLLNTALLDNSTIVRQWNHSWVTDIINNNTLIYNYNASWFWSYVTNGTMQPRLENSTNISCNWTSCWYTGSVSSYDDTDVRASINNNATAIRTDIRNNATAIKSELRGDIDNNASAVRTDIRNNITLVPLKTDIDNNVSMLRNDINNNASAIRTDIRNNATAIKSELRGDIDNNASAVRTDIRNNATAIKSEIRLDITNNATQLRTDIANNASAVRTDIRNNMTLVPLKTDIDNNVSMLRNDINNNASAIRTDIRNNATAIKSEIRLDITNNASAVRTDIRNNITSVRADMATNISGFIRNSTDINVLTINATKINATMNVTSQGMIIYNGTKICFDGVECLYWMGVDTASNTLKIRVN